MKNKAILALQLGFMYLSNLLLWGNIFFEKIASDDLWKYLVGGSFACIIIALVLLVIFDIRSCVSLDENVFENVMVGKFIMLPWYVLTFLAIHFLILDAEEPALRMLFPLIIVIAIGFSILFVLLSSIANGVCYIKYLIHNNKTISLKMSLITILNFIPVVDLVSAIILKKRFDVIKGEQND